MDAIENGVHHSTEEENYVEPKEENIKQKLEEFKDKKLGFMTHFGLFTQLGMVESWALSDELKEDRWSQEGIDWVDDIEEFKDQYWNLNKSFNPLRLDPKRFANAIYSFGFKYVLIPTKHHDGFCLWDTKYSDYKTTNPDCPYHTQEHADIFGSLIKEFQRLGLMSGAYFSKPDWHNDDYWPKEYKKSGKVHRNVGYDVDENPQKWQSFVKYTENQMLEIVKNYAPIDIMWLDGGQVKKSNNQDIKIDEISKKMRKINPDLLVCDRTCGGESENYVTPEQTIPTRYLNIPWESCITLGGPFAYSYRDEYKSVEEVANIFVEVLCKGGNLALNVAPQPDGRLPGRALEVLTEFGNWVKDNEKAIFATRPVAPYYDGENGLVEDKSGQRYLFIKKKKGKFVVPKYIYTKVEFDFTEAKFKGQNVAVDKIGKKYCLTMPDMEIDRKEPAVYVFEIK